MAIVQLSLLLQEIRGKIGSFVFRRCGTRLVLSRAPTFEGYKPTPAQTAHRERFKRATLYAHSVLADPVRKASYEPGARNKRISVFALCVGDYLNPPVVQDLDLSAYTGQAGQTIGITATDDFEVTGVEVTITDANGQRLEQGPAVRDPATDGWAYTTSVAVPAGQRVSIEVTASDRPGNKTCRVQTHPVPATPPVHGRSALNPHRHNEKSAHTEQSGNRPARSHDYDTSAVPRPGITTASRPRGREPCDAIFGKSTAPKKCVINRRSRLRRREVASGSRMALS